MELTHSFTVPASVADTWAAFADISSVAECFPGAAVTKAEGDDFEGTCKVKLGPIALVYGGHGSFLERDEAAGRFVLEAKGKDKRGNGTAGAKVTATLAPDGDAATRVDVMTDLQITGKPAQFGRGVIQDVSDKLLQQFVDCLQHKVGQPAEPEAAAETPEPTPIGEAAAAAAPAASAGAAAAAPSAQAKAAAWTGPAASGAGPAGKEDDALDLGATVLPILLKTYGKQIGVAAAVVAVLWWLLGRRRR